jgi:F420-0:gamma-glutamyl ligase-like protein
MDLQANEGRKLEIKVGDKKYNRYPIKTHFIEMGEDYIELVRKYVLPYYKEGDILSISEKVIALCQKDVILKSDLKVGWLAKLLSGYAFKNPAGPAMDNVYKMQAAIKLAGPLRVFIGAALSAITKPLGIRGAFYSFVGHGVKNIDGFCVVAYEYYADKGILAPSNPDKACQNIKDKLGIDCMIVDANDLGVQILGSNREIRYDYKALAGIIGDNPAGQEGEQTPFILIRELEEYQGEFVTA